MKARCRIQSQGYLGRFSSKAELHESFLLDWKSLHGGHPKAAERLTARHLIMAATAW